MEARGRRNSSSGLRVFYRAGFGTERRVGRCREGQVENPSAYFPGATSDRYSQTTVAAASAVISALS